jgi:hypothetical protein
MVLHAGAMNSSITLLRALLAKQRGPARGRDDGAHGRPAAGELVAQRKAHQRPELADGVLVGELAAELGVEVLRRRRRRLPITVKPLRITSMQIESSLSGSIALGTRNAA